MLHKIDDDNLGKFESRTDEGIFLGYSSTKKEYRCYNLRSHKIIENANASIDDTKPRRIQIQGSVDDEEIDDEKVDDKRKKESTQKKDNSEEEEERVEKEESHENENEYSPRSNTKMQSRWF